MKGLMVAVAVMVGVSGCAGSADGKVAGHNLAVQDAIFATIKDNAGKNLFLLLVMADKPKLCDSLKANRQPKEATSLMMQLARVGTTEILAPDVGDYTVKDGFTATQGNQAVAQFSRQDSSCADTITASAGESKSGLIKVTNIKAESNGTLNGTYDITFGDGSLKGTFNATYCDINVLSSSQPNCE